MHYLERLHSDRRKLRSALYANQRTSFGTTLGANQLADTLITTDYALS